MSKGDVLTYHHVVGSWRNKIDGAHLDLLGDYPSRAAAVAVGRDQARKRKVKHIIYNLDSTIAERTTYAHDRGAIPA